MQHHVAAAIVETGGVFACSKPAHDLAWGMAVIGKRSVESDQNNRRVGATQQFLRAFQYAHFVARNVNAQQTAAPADGDLVDLHARDMQQVLLLDPFALSRHAAAAAATDAV